MTKSTLRPRAVVDNSRTEAGVRSPAHLAELLTRAGDLRDSAGRSALDLDQRHPGVSAAAAPTEATMKSCHGSTLYAGSRSTTARWQLTGSRLAN